MGANKFVPENLPSAKVLVEVDRRVVHHLLLAISSMDLNKRQAHLWMKVANEIGLGMVDGHVQFVPYEGKKES